MLQKLSDRESLIHIEAGDFTEQLPEPHNRFLRGAWHANASYICRFYCGTDGMKADYVQSGGWPISGMLKDGWTAVRRYWLGNFSDPHTQDIIDVMAGKLPAKELHPNEKRVNFGAILLLTVSNSTTKMSAAPLFSNYLYR